MLSVALALPVPALLRLVFRVQSAQGWALDQLFGLLLGVTWCLFQLAGKYPLARAYLCPLPGFFRFRTMSETLTLIKALQISTVT